jgi:MFS family permease
MLDLKLFQERVFSSSAGSAVLNYICVYSIMFLLPFFLIQGRQLSPSQAGLILTAQPLVMAIVAPISGTLSDRVGTRLPSTLGMIVLGSGLVLLSRLGAQSSLEQVVLSLCVTGFGIGTFISPNNSALMGSAPRHRQGIAAGMMATARNVGMVLGVGLAGAIFTTVLAQSQPGSATGLFEATRISFLVASGIAVLGALTSAIRG